MFLGQVAQGLERGEKNFIDWLDTNLIYETNSRSRLLCLIREIPTQNYFLP